MTRVRSSSEAEMIAEFLKAELGSPRFGPRCEAQLAAMNRGRELIETPDLSNTTDNEERRALLGAVRGYGRNEFIFTGFPENVAWELVELSVDELRRAKYARIMAWLLLSQGSALVGEASRNVDPDSIERLCALPELSAHAGTRLRLVAASIRRVAEERNAGRDYPSLIAVQHDSEIVLVEGYVRATAFVLSGSEKPVLVVLGRSGDIGSWLPTRQVLS